MDGSTPINYRYLNMDEKKFYPDGGALIESVGESGLHRAIPNYTNNQVLIAAGRKHFEAVEAIQLSRKLTGLGRFGSV